MTTKARRDLAADLAFADECQRTEVGLLTWEYESFEVATHAIRRALAAEAEVAKLRAELKAENLRTAEWEGAALGYEEENAKLREVIEDFVDHVREVTALIRPNETEFSCDYRRVWSLSRLTEIYSEVPDDAAEDDE